MGFQQGFNGGLAGFQYMQDQQDRLRSQKIQDEALGQQRQVYADKQQRQAQDDEFAKVGRISALIASAPTPEARAMIYGSAKGALTGFAQQHGLPLPEQWDESLLDEVRTIASMSWQGASADAFKPMNVSPGGAIVDPRTGKEIYANSNFAPQKPAWDSMRGAWITPPGGQPQPQPQPFGNSKVSFEFAPGTPQAVIDATQAFAAADQQGSQAIVPDNLPPRPEPQGSEESFGQPMPVTNPQTNKVELVQFGNRGSRRIVNDYTPGPTARESRPPTEAERTAAGYYSRMTDAERELEAVVAGGYKQGNLRDTYTAGQGMRNFLASDLGQQYRQKQEDWVRAKLRKESGAVIGEDEMDREIKTYFPQPGDLPKVIENKKRSREIAMKAMQTSAGRAYEAAEPQGKQIKRTGTLNGRKVVEYTDGTTAYAD